MSRSTVRSRAVSNHSHQAVLAALLLLQSLADRHPELDAPRQTLPALLVRRQLLHARKQRCEILEVGIAGEQRQELEHQILASLRLGLLSLHRLAAAHEVAQCITRRARSRCGRSPLPTELPQRGV